MWYGCASHWFCKNLVTWEWGDCLPSVSHVDTWDSMDDVTRCNLFAVLGSPLSDCLAFSSPSNPGCEKASTDKVLGLSLIGCPWVTCLSQTTWCIKSEWWSLGPALASIVGGGSSPPNPHWMEWFPKEQWGTFPEDRLDAAPPTASPAGHYPFGMKPKCFSLNHFWPNPWSQTNSHPFITYCIILKRCIDVSLTDWMVS
jgi:hypothetical protein